MCVGDRCASICLPADKCGDEAVTLFVLGVSVLVVFGVLVTRPLDRWTRLESLHSPA